MEFFTGASLSLMQAQPTQGPKPFIHKSFRLLYVKDEKNKELGGQGKTQVQWRLCWKALIHHFHPRSNDRVSTDLTSRNFFFAPQHPCIYLRIPNTEGNSSFRKQIGNYIHNNKHGFVS